MHEVDSIPEIFTETIDYRTDGDAMDLGQATFNEDLLYEALTRFAQAWHRANGRSARVLDLCCATGLSAEKVSAAIPLDKIVLVDVDAGMLSRAEQRCSGRVATKSYCCDAVTFSKERDFDLILMNSSYHHIEDTRKLEFLINARSLLSNAGVVLVGENFIFSYGSARSKRQSILEFYTSLLNALSEAGESSRSMNVIRRSGLYCWEGFYEYKVSRDEFYDHVQAAGLKVLECQTVWSATDDLADFAGSCALRLSRS
jgi:SAM-dependent methyltransferase